MTIKSGLNVNTPDRIFVDAGAVYINYGLSTQRLLGATRGGNEFNLNREIRDIEVDGVRGSVKGLRRRTVCRPQITCNLIELSLENLIKAIAGANQAESAEQIVVEEEYPGDGTGSQVLFELANGNIIENTERVFVNAVEKDRSKKYDSRFVGPNAVDNKGFAEGVGDWITCTGSGIEMVSGGHFGNCLKFTAAGTPATGFLTLPGGNGVQLTNLVADQHYRLQIAISKLAGTFTPTTVTFQCTGGPASPEVSITNAFVVHVFEFIATGTDATIEIKSVTGGAPSVDDVFYIDSLELERVDGDYVMNWEEGEVIFAEEGAPPAGEPVTVRYTYTTANVYHDVITGGDIADEDYIDNVALVGTISGKAKDVICIVKNALADTGFSLSTAPRDEAVPVIVFTGHYAAGDPDTEPWEIRYPRA